MEIRRLNEELLDDVVRMHLAGMGYSLNALLGPEHLKYLYRMMAGDSSCYVGVALIADRPAGVVSGSVDAPSFTSRLMKGMPTRRLLHVAGTLLRYPRFIWLWRQGNLIASPLRLDTGEVRAVLTAIVVDAGLQGRGIGRALVGAFEEFLRDAGTQAYRLDTRITNARANQFYRDQGFEEVARRADSIVFVRRLAQ